MSRNDSELSTKQKKFIEALISSPSITAAAERSKLSRKTAHRYLQNPRIREELEKVQGEVTTFVRNEVARAMVSAVLTLEQIAADRTVSPGARVSAARAILEIGLKSETVAIDIRNEYKPVARMRIITVVPPVEVAEGDLATDEEDLPEDVKFVSKITIRRPEGDLEEAGEDGGPDNGRSKIARIKINPPSEE